MAENSQLVIPFSHLELLLSGNHSAILDDPSRVLLELGLSVNDNFMLLNTAWSTQQQRVTACSTGSQYTDFMDYG